MIYKAVFGFILITFVNCYTVEEECLNYTIYPVQYELTITPYIMSEDRFYYDGEVTITVIAKVPGVRVIELDAMDLEIKRETVGVWFDNRNIIEYRRPFEYDKEHGKLYIYLKEELKQYGVQNNQYHIKISFSKYLKHKENGIFLIRFDDQGKDRYMLSTRMSPNYAKNVFPCIENPKFEAVFKFRINLPPEEIGLLHSTTNLVVAQEMLRHINRDKYMVIEFIPSPQISTHQVGLHLSNFLNLQKAARFTNETILVWAPPSSIQHYSLILDFAVDIVNSIHLYTNFKRPITNGPINIVGLPANIHSYEKESWNLLTNGNHKLSYYVQFTSAKQKQDMLFDLSQQLSRIWLGNPGEPERTRWKQDWLKEGMATYFAYYFLSQTTSIYDMKTHGLQMRYNAMKLDSHTAVPSLSSFNETQAIFLNTRQERLVAMKTSALLWMIENWLGTDIFHSSVKQYIKSRRGKTISIDDFADHLQKSSVHCRCFKGNTVSDVLNSWTQQQGYPVITVSVFRQPGEEDAVHLEQKHFVYDNRSRRDYKYLIPISYIVQYKDVCNNCFQPKFTIGNSEYTFKENLKNGWIILNRNASGYYRVNYDRETWYHIINTLQGSDSNKIDQYNKAQIVNDAFALYMAGEITLKLTTDILNFLEHETSYVVWNAAISGFDMLKIEGANVHLSKQLYNYWKILMRDKVSYVYTKLVNKFDRDDQSRLFRSKVIQFSCFIGHALCLRDLEGEIKRIRLRQTYDPDLREACYYAILNRANGWESVLRAQHLNSFEEEDALLSQELSKHQGYFQASLPSEPAMNLILSTTAKPAITKTMKPVAALHHERSSALSYLNSHLYVIFISILLTIIS